MAIKGEASLGGFSYNDMNWPSNTRKDTHNELEKRSEWPKLAA